MQKVKIEEVVADPNQPRKYFGAETMAKLKDSIRKHGIMNPIIVEKAAKGYLIIDGERRFRAASQLNLKEIPIIVVSSKNPFDRLIEQFHIQEQHESWSLSEKAMAILEIGTVAKKTVTEIAELLSINQTQVKMYNSFSKIINKDMFLKHSLNIRNSEKIQGIKNIVSELKVRVLEDVWTAADENKLEKLLIGKIINGEITEPFQFTKVKDSFKADPAMIDVFMKGNIEVNEMFVKSKAQAAYHTRNMLNNASFLAQHANAFIAGKNVKLSEDDMRVLTRCRDALNKAIKMVE